MEDWEVISLLERKKRDCSYEFCKVIDRSIDALYFEIRARELFKACVELLSKQKESSYALNMLDETVYYDEAECDGRCLIDDILSLLIDG